MPLTVWCRVTAESGTIGAANEINLAILYYQVQSDNDEYVSRWFIAKQITNTRWEINFNSQVKLFGRNVLTVEQIRRDTGRMLKRGDKIILYVYFRNASASGSGTRIINKSTEPKITYQGDGVWSVTPRTFVINNACLMQVTYNGQKTIGR